jgi:stalled ribosome rescue protein Dom34
MAESDRPTRRKGLLMSYLHSVVWIDHHHATVIDFTFDDTQVIEVDRVGGQQQVHRRSGVPGSGKAPIDHQFFDEVAAAVGDAVELLIVGPGVAKTEFQHDLVTRHESLAKKVVAVQSADHPSPGELLAFARKYFKRVDALRGDA